MKTKLTLIITLAACCLCGNIFADPPLPGAIFSTDSTCLGVDLNIYASKDAVYIDGGPAHLGAAGLTPGTYCVQVTDPSGATVLGKSAEGAVTVDANGEFQQCYQLTSILNTASSGFTVAGYDDTSNPGGEYKVWVSTDCNFINNSTKTDNFKVRENAPPNPPRLCVNKFYDANVNGVKDPTECYINGWPFQVFADNNLYVQAETSWCGLVDEGAYRVVEGDIANWVHTGALINGVPFIGSTSDVYPVTLPPDQTVEFGNVCLGAGGGLTLGFWSNKNGQKLENAADLLFLRGLCLRNANGTDFDPTTNAALSTWLLAANATNMANMLSAQLAAMELNVRHSFVNGNALVYEQCLTGYGYPTGFISINTLMSLAAGEICAHGNTPSGNQYRAYQECLKNALDDANNNKNFVQSQPCSPFTCAQ
jgi:hypothetical protein